MHIKKLLPILIGLFSVTTQAVEESFKGGISCSVEVLSSTCATGEIKLIANQYGSFDLDYGDIGCWNLNSRFKGGHKLIAATPSQTVGEQTKLYKLVATTAVSIVNANESIASTPIGTMEYDNRNNVVLLKIDKTKFNGARGEQYHLKCQGKLL